MRFLTLLAFLISGCSTHMKIAGKNFSNTTSPCMDGVLTNIDYSGCKGINISQVPGENAYRVKCAEPTATTAWTTFTFYFVAHDSDFYRADWGPICMDPTLNVYYVSDPNNGFHINVGSDSVMNEKVPGSCFDKSDDAYQEMGPCEFESAMPKAADHCSQAWSEKYITLFPNGCEVQE